MIYSLLLVGMLTGCQESRPPLLIGILYNGETDPGQSLRMSALLSVEQINSKGGLTVAGEKRQVELKFADTHATQENTLRAAMTLLESQPLLVVGPNASQEMAAVVDLFEKAQVPVISPAASLPDLVGNRKYVFRLIPSDQKQAETLALLVSKHLQATKVACLFKANNAYSRNLARSFSEDLRKRAGVGSQLLSYVTGESKFEKQIARLKELNPEVILLPNDYEDVINQMIRLRNAGLQSTFVGGDSWHPHIFASIPQAQDSWFVHHWLYPKDELKPNEQQFVKAFKKKYRLEPTIVSALSFDAMNLAFDAIRRSKASPQSVRFQITTTQHFPGITGSVSYNRSGEPDRAINLFHLLQGRVETVSADNWEKIQ